MTVTVFNCISQTSDIERTTSSATNNIYTLNKLTFYTDDFHFLLDPFLRENGFIIAFIDALANH